MVRISNIMLNKSGKGGHPCLVLVFREKFQPFTIEYDVGYGFFINGLHYVEICSYTHFDNIFF